LNVQRRKYQNPPLDSILSQFNPVYHILTIFFFFFFFFFFFTTRVRFSVNRSSSQHFLGLPTSNQTGFRGICGNYKHKFFREKVTGLSHNLQPGGPEFSVGVLSPRQAAFTVAKKPCLLPHIPGQGS
jgi:hypothetical protein